MGEFLSTPLKDKHSEDGENTQVSKKSTQKKKISFVMVPVQCKVGVSIWKMHI